MEPSHHEDHSTNCTNDECHHNGDGHLGVSVGLLTWLAVEKHPGFFPIENIHLQVRQVRSICQHLFQSHHIIIIIIIITGNKIFWVKIGKGYAELEDLRPGVRLPGKLLDMLWLQDLLFFWLAKTGEILLEAISQTCSAANPALSNHSWYLLSSS